MARIALNVTDAVESEIVPEGEYDLRIVRAVDGPSKDGTRTNIKVTIAIESADHPNAQPITHYLSTPKDDDADNTVNFMKLNIARFCQAFGIDYDDDGFDTDDFEGKTATLPVRIEETQNKNKINTLVLPRLEVAEEKAKPVDKKMAGKTAPRRR